MVSQPHGGEEMNERECIEWVMNNMPFAVKPIKKAKTELIYPYTSYHSQQQVARCIGEQLFKLLTRGDK
jgi:hypothetical protein